MKKTALLCLVCTSAVLASDRGIRPRPAASDYPAQEQKDGFAVGASVVPRHEVKNLFATNLKDYVVVEVSVYPEQGKPVDLSPRDFALRIGSDSDIIRPANPRAIAGVIQKKNAPPPSKASDITVYPTATIGYESGGYDPVYGGQRRGGWVTSTGVGVGVGGGQQGPPPPRSTDRDRDVMKQELEEQALPPGSVTKPVAGYLYFALPEAKQKKGGAYELNYYGASGKMRILFPPVPK
jgi:hypothetical protein